MSARWHCGTERLGPVGGRGNAGRPGMMAMGMGGRGRRGCQEWAACQTWAAEGQGALAIHHRPWAPPVDERPRAVAEPCRGRRRGGGEEDAGG